MAISHSSSFMLRSVTLTKQNKRKASRKITKVAPGINTPDAQGWTQLMWACNREPVSAVQQKIAAGAEVHKSDADGFGPMMCACVEGRTAVVKCLLANGAAADQPDSLGRTPLSWAVTRGDFVDTAELLISAGANVNRADKDGFTPLMRAALMNHVRCFELLIRNGADPKPVNLHWRKNALEMALDRGSDDLKRIAEKAWPRHRPSK